MSELQGLVDAFIVAATVPVNGWHGSGTVERANALLMDCPEISSSCIHVAAILGDGVMVLRFLEDDAGLALLKRTPHGWDPLTSLCFSNYLRLDPARSPGFLQAAKALLDAGASPNTGWLDTSHSPDRVWEAAIYGAAGIAQNPGLTQLLLDHGADPNDEETPYHVPETYDNTILKILVSSGKLNDDSLATLLLRKADWHDQHGIEWLLKRGANPNRNTRWGKTAFQQAVLRDNVIEIVDAMLDHGADPGLHAEAPLQSGLRAATQPIAIIAARRGRGDILASLLRRGLPLSFEGVDRLIAACASNDRSAIDRLVHAEPALLQELRAQGGTLLAEFSGNGNADGVQCLLDLGVSVNAVYDHGDGYFGIAPISTALHVAAWRARPATVRRLIERGANVNAVDYQRRTPLQLAVKACVDSYWKARRTPESVRALLQAGAVVQGIAIPTGYEEIDVLLTV